MNGQETATPCVAQHITRQIVCIILDFEKKVYVYLDLVYMYVVPAIIDLLSMLQCCKQVRPVDPYQVPPVISMSHDHHVSIRVVYVYYTSQAMCVWGVW